MIHSNEQCEDTEHRSSSIVVSTTDEKSLEEKFFGFSPPRFVDDVCIMMGDYVSDTLAVFESQLRKDLGKRVNTASTLKEVTISTCMKKLRENFQQASDINLDRLELYALRNILTIPDSIAPALAESISMSDSGNNNQKQVHIGTNLDENDKSLSSTCKDTDIISTQFENEKELDFQIAATEKSISTVIQCITELKELISQHENQIIQGKENLKTLGFVDSKLAPQLVEKILLGGKKLQQQAVEGQETLTKLHASNSAQKKRDASAPAGNTTVFQHFDANDLKRFKAKILGESTNMHKQG